MTYDQLARAIEEARNRQAAVDEANQKINDYGPYSPEGQGWRDEYNRRLRQLAETVPF